IERHDGDRTLRLCREDGEHPPHHQPDRIDSLEAFEVEGAQPDATVEIDDVEPAGIGPDAGHEIAARLAGDRGDRLWEIVRLGLAPIDQGNDVDPGWLLLRRHPHETLAAAERGD